MPALEHPSDAKLAAVLNQPMPPDEVERILEHLDQCRTCDRRQEELEPAIAEFRRFRRRMEPQLPQPPRPWADMWAEMDRLDHRPLKLISEPRHEERSRARRVLRPAWMSAAAAGILIAGLMLWPRGDSLLRAETLLKKASVAASHSTARTKSHLRVKTRTASFVRPAVLVNDARADGMDTVRTRFEAAHYDWSDPLNAVAFGNWRANLTHKTDKVAVTSAEPKQYTIETSTSEGGLREAALTIEAKDLLPVSGRFEFADAEWVEIAAVPEVPEPAPAPIPVPGISPAPAPAPSVAAPPALSESELAERELEVRAAIDHLHADAGEPIGIETESGKVVVTIYNLAPQQEGQLRASLQGMEGVVVRSPDHSSDTPRTGQAAAAAPFPAIDTSEGIVARAHLLDQLATRFPPEVEAKLSANGRATLRDMRARHLAAINRDIDTLVSQLSGTRPLSVGQEPSAPDTATAASLAQAAASVHRLVTSVYAGGNGQVDAASVWPELASELSRLRHLASQRQ